MEVFLMYLLQSWENGCEYSITINISLWKLETCKHYVSPQAQRIIIKSDYRYFIFIVFMPGTSRNITLVYTF